jgi:glycosyltransferase involved in cell wall biosynthesis
MPIRDLLSQSQLTTPVGRGFLLSTKSMNILYTTHQFYPDYCAGTELLTYMTASQMRSKGHNVRIVTGYPSEKPPEPNQTFDEYIFDNLTVNRYRHSSFHPVRSQCIMEAEHKNTLVKKWFLRICKKFKPDLVHVFHLQRLSSSILEVCCELKIPFVITVTDFWMICPTTQLLLADNKLCAGPNKMMENCIKHLSTKTKKPIIRNIVQKLPDKIIREIIHLLRWFPKLRIGSFVDIYALTKRPHFIIKQVNKAKRIMVTNKFMQSILQENGVNSKLMIKIPFGINRVEGSDKPSIPKDDCLTVGFIGTLNYHKGAHILIKAVRHIDTSKKIILNIYGDREQFPSYVSMLDDLVAHDTRIDFKGTFTPDRIGGVLSSLDVLVVPSLWYENTPLILHQAHAAKVPVFATDLGGMNEIVKDGINGFLIAPGNVNQLSNIILSLLKDRSQLEKLRNQIDTPMFIDQYASILEHQYHEILTEKHGD